MGLISFENRYIMNDLRKSASRIPARRKDFHNCIAQDSFFDPSEINNEEDYSFDDRDYDLYCQESYYGRGFHPRDVDSDSHGHSYDHDDGDRGCYDSGCGNPSDAG